MRRFLGATRRFPRAEPSYVPDTIVIRDFRTNCDEILFLVEARQGSRVLGDKQFITHQDAKAFGKIESGWHACKLIDHVSGARG
jgi:hypothetical protein